MSERRYWLTVGEHVWLVTEGLEVDLLGVVDPLTSQIAVLYAALNALSNRPAAPHVE